MIYRNRFFIGVGYGILLSIPLWILIWLAYEALK
jgi:hypothetical protein